MWLPRMTVPTRGRGEKICGFRRLRLRNSSKSSKFSACTSVHICLVICLYAFGNSTTNLVIQSSSFTKSARIESNVDRWTWMLMDIVYYWTLTGITYDAKLSTRKLKSQLRFMARDWFAFGNSTTNLVIQSSSFPKSAYIESNVDRWTWMLMDIVYYWTLTNKVEVYKSWRLR